MKVLQISNADGGGAGKAAFRLHQGLKEMGVTSQMLVRYKGVDDDSILAPKTPLSRGMAGIKPMIDKLPLKFYPRRDPTMFSPQWVPDSLYPQVHQISPDIINLHWVCNGYLAVETLPKFAAPLVWTLHDMWAFTGGCHYSQGCERYTDACGICPHLGSQKESDLSHWIWRRKIQAWQTLNLTLVTPSIWLAKCARSSSLFKDHRIEIIPNGIDPQQYKPISRSIAREILNLPQDKQLILFGAMSATGDRRKGFQFLQPALKLLSQSGLKEQINLVIFGSSAPQEPLDLGFQSYYLGRLNDDISLALVYAAADVFVAPSVEDNLPNTVGEALACGVPCVAFNIGGMPDMIEHGKNGYLAQAYEVAELAQGINWILEDSERHQVLCHHAREKFEQEFTLEKQASRYLALFTELVENSSRL